MSLDCKYTRFDTSVDSTHNLIVSLVPPAARVLEFGCATGYMSAVLKERLGCSVTGIELDRAAGKIAHESCDRVIVGDAEILDYDDLFVGERFDVLLFADVLEHLREPSALLRRTRPLLAAGGAVIASLPNIAHGSIRIALLGGEFRYQPTGLLDGTHLRFFTRETVQELFEEAGYVITDWLRKRVAISRSEVTSSVQELPQLVQEQLSGDPEATTYQFVVRAIRAEEASMPHSARADVAAVRTELDIQSARNRKVQAQLQERAEEAARHVQQVADREAVIRDLQAALNEKRSVRREVARIRKLLEEQAGQIGALAEQITSAVTGQQALQSGLTETREELLRRDEDLQATLYDLQLTVGSRQIALGQIPNSSAEQPTDDLTRTYRSIIRRLREVVRLTVPRDATIAVVSRGDEELLNLYGRTAWHYPRLEDGRFAGEYPASSTAAIVQLETVRALGANFLLFPNPAFWWFEHYLQFKQYLDQRYYLVTQDDACALYDIREPAGAPATQPSLWSTFEELVAECDARLGRSPAILDWETGLEVAARFPQLTVFAPAAETNELPYLDSSIDIVAVSASNPNRLTEARRVSAGLVLSFVPAPERRGNRQGRRELAIEAQWKLDEAPAPPLPTTSIIIPCYNNFSYTKACLRALWETLPRNFRGEIIVVDDASTDETSCALQIRVAEDERLKVIRNATNVGFIASCNRGARAASGEILVFLNNDTLPLPGWLPPLLRIFRERPDAGAVGGKLIYPDGRLQEAGGVIFADGTGANFGRGGYEIDAPIYNYLREVDYCSGALLATRRDLFTDLGGFDTRYCPAYYEDTDYCFAVRERGYRVYYQPESAIIHREGATSGTDDSAGVKQYQSINRLKFLEKWEHVLSTQAPLPVERFDFPTWYRLAIRGRAGDTQ